MKVMEQHVLPEHLVVPVADHMKSFDLDVWLYRGPTGTSATPRRRTSTGRPGPSSSTPKVMDGFDGLTDGVVKLVGVSDDHKAIDAASESVCDKFGDDVTAAASQPYYLDVTNPQADKGSVAAYLARRYKLSPSRSPPSATSPTTS